jgi:NADH dehydrogenase
MQLVLAETHRRALLPPMTFGLARLEAALMELPAKLVSFLPDPALTRDQVELLKHDNVVSSGALMLRDLGIEPTAVEAVVPSYLVPYRRHGWFGARGMEA